MIGKQIRPELGNHDQLGYIRRSRLSEGPTTGMEIIDIRTSTGLDLTVVPEPALDIADVFFKGRCVSFASPNGLQHPSRFDVHGIEWLSSFSGGLLTTCGLSSLGPPGPDLDEELGLHGRITAMSASGISASSHFGEKVSGLPVALSDSGNWHVVSGSICEARLFGPRLHVFRSIHVSNDEPIIVISDTVTNYGFEHNPFVILYHMNLGFPLLSPSSRLDSTDEQVHAHSDAARRTRESWSDMPSPESEAEEELFTHCLSADSDGRAHVMLENHDIELGLSVSVPVHSLPFRCQWKLMKSGEYALGVEPGNVPVMNRSELRELGILPQLSPGETWSSVVEVRVVDGKREIDAMIDRRSLSTQAPTSEVRYGRGND